MYLNYEFCYFCFYFLGGNNILEKLNVYIGFYLEVYIFYIFEVSEIIFFKNGFFSIYYVFNYKIGKKLYYNIGDIKFIKLLLILIFRVLVKSYIKWVNI